MPFRAPAVCSVWSKSCAPPNRSKPKPKKRITLALTCWKLLPGQSNKLAALWPSKPKCSDPVHEKHVGQHQRQSQRLPLDSGRTPTFDILHKRKALSDPGSSLSITCQFGFTPPHRLASAVWQHECRPPETRTITQATPPRPPPANQTTFHWPPTAPKHRPAPNHPAAQNTTHGAFDRPTRTPSHPADTVRMARHRHSRFACFRWGRIGRKVSRPQVRRPR